MKVLYVDPWGNGSYYPKGVISSVVQKCKLIVVENFYFDDDINHSYELHRWFFRFSEKLKQGKIIRRILRCIEYIVTWVGICILISIKKPDILHVNWFLLYRV